MCGRYTLTATEEQLLAEFELLETGHVSPNTNVCPTQQAPVVRLREHNGGRVLEYARWGLIPSWSKGPDNRFTMINARSEDVAIKPAFRDAYRRRRCLVPTNGFYEWKAIDGAPKSAKKQQYVFRRSDSGLVALGGLWERWVDPAGKSVDSFTILTMAANDIVAPIHDRMPVVIAAEHYGRWLDPALTDPASLQQLLAAGPVTSLMRFTVEAA